MKCQKCNNEFLEEQIDVSHDVPVYLFDGFDRKEKKNQADKWGRHNLCKKCHHIYEGIAFSVAVKAISSELRHTMKEEVKKFAQEYFK